MVETLPFAIKKAQFRINYLISIFAAITIQMRIRSGLFSGLIFLLLVFIIAASCKKEEPVDQDPSLRLGFSTDTVFFDTVFTSVGSATQIFKVFNPSEDKIIISSIELARGESSPYRFNIDGISSTRITDLEIAGKDSAFVFVKVTIDPNLANTPLVQSDSIVFITITTSRISNCWHGARMLIFTRMVLLAATTYLPQTNRT